MTAETLRQPLLHAEPIGPASHGAQRLDGAPRGIPFSVRHVDHDPRVPERSRQLEEIGFFPGEHVMVMTRGFPGADPLVVRIGLSTFALRRDEAACVQVEPMPHHAAA